MGIIFGFTTFGAAIFSGIIYFDVDGPTTIFMSGGLVLVSIFYGAIIQRSPEQ